MYKSHGRGDVETQDLASPRPGRESGKPQGMSRVSIQSVRQQGEDRELLKSWDAGLRTGQVCLLRTSHLTRIRLEASAHRTSHVTTGWKPVLRRTPTSSSSPPAAPASAS